ncbi:hypothetical protein BDZ45DRAFT_809507 [Acephala macrosclerotiorum]|nr:hypothetical protein BDZ45DRAFT_809507 [Acephala macrosclerotiorum]
MDRTRPRRANEGSHKSKPRLRPGDEIQALNDQVDHRILDAKEVLYDDCNPAHPPFDRYLFPGGQEEYVLLRSNTRKTRYGDLFCWWIPKYLWNKGDYVHGLDHPKREGHLERCSEYIGEVLGVEAKKDGVSTSVSDRALLPLSPSKSTTVVGTFATARTSDAFSGFPAFRGFRQQMSSESSRHSGRSLFSLAFSSPRNNGVLWTSGHLKSPGPSRNLSSSWIYNPKLAASKARQNSVVAADIKNNNNQTGMAKRASLRRRSGTLQATFSSNSGCPASSGSFPNSVPTEPKATRTFVIAPNSLTGTAQATSTTSNSVCPMPSGSFPISVPTEPKAMRKPVKVLRSQTNNTTSTARATILGLSGNPVPIAVPTIPKSMRMPVKAPAPQKKYQTYAEATATRHRMGSPSRRQRADDPIQVGDPVIEDSSTQARHHRMGSPPKKQKMMSADGIKPGW